MPFTRIYLLKCQSTTAVFPAYEVNIEKFGAKGDGMFLNTKAINDAIKDVNQHGGGKVIIPEGIWLDRPYRTAE